MPAAKFDRTIDAIYRAALEPGTWNRALEDVADYVGADGAMIVHNDIARERGEILVGRLRDDLCQLYLQRHCANPLVLAVARRGTTGSAALGSSYIEAASLRRSELHADILAPQRIVDLALLPLLALSPGGGTGGFGVTLNQRQADDGARVVARLGRLGPHLSRAFDLSLEVVRHQDEAGRLGALLDLMPAAAILLDRSGRITRANPAADRLLSSGHGVTGAPGRWLGAMFTDDDRRLRRAVAGAIAFGAGDVGVPFEGTLLLRCHAGRPPLLVVITPLPQASFRFLDVAETAAMLLVRIFDPADRVIDQERLLREAYGLTPTEARVASRIAQGLSAPRVSAHLGISLNTVRTHLARAFDKTGARSQVTLALLVASVGPVRFADRG